MTTGQAYQGQTNMDALKEQKDKYEELIFEMRQENQHLRGQITYLQEALSACEDEMAEKVRAMQAQIDALERELGRP